MHLCSSPDSTLTNNQPRGGVRPSSSWTRRRSSAARNGAATANLHTKILDFRGYDSSRILLQRGGILMSIGNFLESLSPRILVGIILVIREIGRRSSCARVTVRASRAVSGEGDLVAPSTNTPPSGFGACERSRVESSHRRAPPSSEIGRATDVSTLRSPQGIPQHVWSACTKGSHCFWALLTCSNYYHLARKSTHRNLSRAISPVPPLAWPTRTTTQADELLSRGFGEQVRLVLSQAPGSTSITATSTVALPVSCPLVH